MTSTSAPHPNPSWQTSSWEEMSGPMRKRAKLVARPASLRLKTATRILRFHRVGTRDKTELKKLSKARCHQGNGTLNNECGTPSGPTAESTQTPRAPLNGPSKGPTSWEDLNWRIGPSPCQRTFHQTTPSECALTDVQCSLRSATELP